LSPLGFAACQSKKCTNRVDGTVCLVGAAETAAPPEKCTVCFVGALETSAPPGDMHCISNF